MTGTFSAAVRDSVRRPDKPAGPAYSGSMPAVPSTAGIRRNEQHRCSHCGSRFEVWHAADPMETAVSVDVTCPCCSGAHTISLPRGAEKDFRVEPLPGPEPDTGVVD